jgi:3-hydroxyisobutyrate dehydrogenase-like beta-hydroxyacid dehydrogenase
MAEALLAAGRDVCGYDVRTAARQRLRKAGGRPLASSTAVAASADVIITSLATVDALAEVTRQIAHASRNGGRRARIVIETSTLPLADKERAMRALQRVEVAMLDCPISGTAVRMKEGAWTIFASGKRAAFQRILPLLNVFTKNVRYVGGFGNGMKMKFIANHLVAIYNVAAAEALTFALKMGLDPREALDVFGPSPVVGNGVLRLRGRMMTEGRYEPATMKVSVWQKDMQVIGDMTRAVGSPTPLFSACIPVYNAAMAQGLADADTASVHAVLGRMAGIPAKK